MSQLAVTGGTNLQQLQTFLQANAGKDIRAKQDDQGNVTLYARSSWKPSARFFTQMGDMSGRTAKQDLARSAIKGIMTKQGVSGAKADQLLGTFKGDLKATASNGKGIWIGGKGFNFPGMQAHTGLSEIVRQAEHMQHLKAQPFTEQLQHPVLGPIIREGCRAAYCPELSNCLDALNTLGKRADGCSDQQIHQFVARFMGANNSPEVINNDLMGSNTPTSGIEGFKNDVATWDALPQGPGRETAKQELLDSLHTTLASGVDSMIRNDVTRRIPDYQAL
jgi:hypothetical protein